MSSLAKLPKNVPFHVLLPSRAMRLNADAADGVQVGVRRQRVCEHDFLAGGRIGNAHRLVRPGVQHRAIDMPAIVLDRVRRFAPVDLEVGERGLGRRSRQRPATPAAGESTTPGISTPRLYCVRPDGIVSSDLPVHHALARRALHVHDRRFTGDGDRLFERTDPHVGVHRRDERAGQLDAFALDGVEARQRERDVV